MLIMQTFTIDGLYILIYVYISYKVEMGANLLLTLWQTLL